jgi:hypothetical protein
MKSMFRVLSFGLPFAAIFGAGVNAPVDAQVTSIPVTGTVSGTVFTNGVVSLNSYSLLSPVGTVSGTNGTITGVSSGGIPIFSINVGTTADVVGTTTGGVVFNDGRSASFVMAPTTFNATVNSIVSTNPAIPVTTISFLFPPLADTNVGLTINSGSISIPTSSIVNPVLPPVGAVPPPVVIVTSPGIDSALVILDPAFSPKPSTGPQIVTAFSSDPNAIFYSSLTSRVFPGLGQ